MWKYFFSAIVFLFLIFSLWAARDDYGVYYFVSLGCFFWSGFEIYSIIFRDSCYVALGFFVNKGWSDVDVVIPKLSVLIFYIFIFVFSASYGIIN